MMNLRDAPAVMPPIPFLCRIAAALSPFMLAGALAGCSEARSDTGRTQALAPSHAEAVAATDERPGCRKEFPIEFRGISCAGHDYDPPPIPFGELYPPR